MSNKNGTVGLKVTPRHYQLDAIRGNEEFCGIWNGWYKENHNRLLCVMAGGCGKTILFSMLTNHTVKNLNKKTLILAHRGELINQAIDKLYKSTGIVAAKEKADETGVNSGSPVVVGSIQTLSRESRLKRYDKSHFDYIIIDEAHRALAKSYINIVDHFNSARVLGVTATAMRGDERGLGLFFDKIAFEYPLDKGINDGWLTPITAVTCPLDIDLDAGIRKDENERRARGITTERPLSADPSDNAVDLALEPILEAVVLEIKTHASNRKTLIFLPLRKTSIKMAGLMNAAGIECRHIDGSMSDDEKLEHENWFRKSAPGTAMCNVLLWTEGFDQPDIDCVVVLRPTKSTGLYIQMVVRGTRVLDESINAPGLTAEERKGIVAASAKKDMLILDFLFHSATHQVCHPARLFAENPEIEQKMNEISQKGGKKNLMEVEAEAHDLLVCERESALAESLKAFIGKTTKKFDPVMQAISIFDDSLINWRPEVKWQGEPISQAQEDYLSRNGFDCSGWKKGYASKVMEDLAQRREQNLATPNQVRCLLRNGFPQAARMSFDDAKAAMDKLSKRWEKSKKWKGKKR